MTDTLKDRIRASSVGPYKKTTALLLRKDIKGSGRFVNDKKVSDHHAIIPTEQSVRLTEMSADERKIYDMVVRRFLAVLMDPSVSEQIQIQGEISGEHLRTRAVLQKKAGWKDAYEEQEQEENMQKHVYEKSFDVNISGDFTVTFTNDCLYPHTVVRNKYKDAVGFLSVEWTGYSAN